MGLSQWNVKQISDIWKLWQQHRFDGIIVFDGNRGLGKSSAALKCAFRFPQFKIQRDLIYSREELMNQLAEQKFGILIADEMINVT